MKITKTTTTLYDTNGKQISVVRKEKTVTEIPIILNREDGNAIHQIAETYKADLKNAKAIKKNLEEVQGFVKGNRIFHSMANLIMVVNRPAVSVKEIKKNIAAADSVLEAAATAYLTDVKIGETSNKKHQKDKGQKS